MDSVARLAGALTFPAYQRGRVATVKRWLGWLEDRAAMESYPAIAVLAALFCALTGEPTYAELWADVAHRGPAVTRLPDGSPSVEPWLALIRALLCRDGWSGCGPTRRSRPGPWPRAASGGSRP